MHGYRERSYIQVPKKEIKKFSLGDEVELISKGKVVELRAEEKYNMLSCCDEEEDKKERKEPPSIVIELESVTVKSGKNEFAALVEDDDD